MPDGSWKGGLERREDGQSGLGRRDFLKASGFGLAALLASCRRVPVDRAVPYLRQPEDVVPGVATWYATACGGCSAGCGALAKCRDGRPIKLEGLPEHPLSGGGLCAVGQASLLELYDSHRFRGPRLGGEEVDWERADGEVRRRLDEIAAAGGAVRLLTGTVHSPTERRWIERFLGRFADGEHVVYDPLSAASIVDAHRRTHGRRALPRYRFDRAETIVSLGADFLGTWISPVEYAAAYRRGRDPDGDPARVSFHAQVEGRMSLTGSNADLRLTVDPQDGGLVVAHLLERVARRAGAGAPFRTADALPPPPLPAERLDELVERLWRAGDRALVVCDSQRLADQVRVNALHEVLGAYGSTVDLAHPSQQRQGDDRALARLCDELEAGRVDALLVRGVDPLYDLPRPDLAAAVERLPLAVSLASGADATSAAAGMVCPEPHPLESWRDGAPVAGLATLAQPAVRPLFATRPFVASLAAWSGEPASDRELVRRHWEGEIFARSAAAGDDFQAFWDRAVHDGFAEVPVDDPATPSFDPAALAELEPPARSTAGGDGEVFTLELYPKVGILDGRHAHNPWLQELPDPVTKVTWDNYACLSPAAARRLGVDDGDLVRLEAEDGPEADLELPVRVQPGQHDGVVAVALGYGHPGTDRFHDLAPRWLQGEATVAPGETVGGNAAPWTVLDGAGRGYRRRGVAVTATGGRRPLAATQTYDRLAEPPGLGRADGELRPIVQETTLAAYRRDPAAGAPHAHQVEADLWGEHEFEGHHWGMAVDLQRCTGCSACVVACQAENNVPVVGRDEVRRRREMHWLRIDRYYREDLGDGVSVSHQPMLCHHCDNAPCETVCPVLATVHSSEGLNQQVYNRCVGTRYCANNCPFKVRRFNWFDYDRDDQLQNLVLNPDVVVRSRGVMEKCSFCVQRIQEAKNRARSRGEALADGAVTPACQQSCPTGAIVFGDGNDPGSELARRRGEPRHYRLLPAVNLRPSVGYLRRVRNRPDDRPAEHGGEEHHG